MIAKSSGENKTTFKSPKSPAAFFSFWPLTAITLEPLFYKCMSTL